MLTVNDPYRSEETFVTEETQKTIAVVGATGAQGGGVVSALQAQGEFKVRALTRNPDKAEGLGDEVVAADLTNPETLNAALEGVYGVFANTDSWAGPDVDEVAQGTAVVEAAKAGGCGALHLVNAAQC